jgi:adenylate kinase family enzyme
MHSRPSAPGFLVDGFPRNQDNLDGWQHTMSEKAKVLFVLVLNAPLEVCVQRCLNRGQGRTDDNEVSDDGLRNVDDDHMIPQRILCANALSHTMNTQCQ